MTSSLRNRLYKVAFLIVAALSISPLSIAGTRADTPFVFDETPGRLPKTVVPIHYALDLEPDLDKLSVAGHAAIDIEAHAPTSRLVLNALGMTFSSASVDAVGPASDIAFDAEAQTVTLTFPQPLEIGHNFVMPVVDAMHNVPVTMKIEAREVVKTSLGTFKTIRVQPTADAGVVKNRGNIWIWYTDDDRHLPVQMRARLFWGTITFRLIGNENK